MKIPTTAAPKVPPKVAKKKRLNLRCLATNAFWTLFIPENDQRKKYTANI